MTIRKRINQLIPPRSRGKRRLAALSSSRSIAAAVGIGTPGAGQGIKGPLTEQYRVLYEEELVYSSSGLFVFRFAEPQRMAFIDGNGSQFEILFNQQAETA